MNVYLYLQIASALRVSILRGDYITEQQMPPIAIIIHPTTFYCSFLCLDMSI